MAAEMSRAGVRVLLLGTLLLPQLAGAAQMVALDMRATGGVAAGLAETLTPVLITELSRRPGMSIVSQADVQALLENEARKQNLGCEDDSCMTEIAGSLGAELLVSSSLGKVGRKWVVQLTLIEVEKAQVFRRVTGEQMGGEEAAAEAVIAAVHNLFKDGLPAELQGPASMSRRGFKAALLGFAKQVRDPAQDPKPARRRIVLDLVNTELDYDVEPKIRRLDLTSRRQIGALDDEVLVAKDPVDAARLFTARAQWVVVRQDLERVKEIRTRARERGVAPSGRPLRFEDPEPTEGPSEADIAAYKKAAPPARELVKRALRAYSKRQRQAFLGFWGKEHQKAAERVFDNQHQSDQRNGFSYRLVPLYALSPRFLESGIGQNKKGEMLIYLAKLKKGAPYNDDRVYLIREGGAWKIRGW